MQHGLINGLVDETNGGEDDPIIAPLMREQLESMMGGVRDGGASSGERALMRALMQDAVLCLLGDAAPAKERQQLADEARDWVRSRSRDWIFSFASVCDVLGLNPEYAREKLLAMAGEATPDACIESGRAAERRSLRGLRHGGQRPRRAIHFARERRRAVAAA